MNARQLTLLTDLTQKLESRPLYRHFITLCERECNARVISLPEIKRKLIERRYGAVKDWVSEIISYFTSIIEDSNCTLVEKYAARTLSTWIHSKTHSLELEPTLDSWLSSWCQSYKAVTELITSAPPKLGIPAHPMTQDVTGPSLFEFGKMKDDIEQRLSPEQRRMLAQLILTLEPLLSFRTTEEVVFDLARVQTRTLLAIKTFLKNRLDEDRVQLFDS
jgi:hypothetical protein